MKRLHIIGGKNHGKTTLIEELLWEFSQRGIRVGTIKHTHHHHELDIPGKDSHRHRLAGAATVGILTPKLTAVFVEGWQADLDHEERYALLNPLYPDCHLVLVEGDSRTSAPKIEMWRGELDSPPLAQDDPTILAIVTDDVPSTKLPILPRKSIARVTDWICSRLDIAMPG